MKPIRLIMSAWGPYADKVEVDFTKLTQGSLFLITGPTGAGKTTIFDGITYALYGDVSGQNREKTSVRSDFANPDIDTYVDFTFSHKGEVYHIVRSPKYERKKKRGDGVTTSLETALLEREGQPPVTSVQEVTRKVTELLGLNYAQFKQIVMIAQGEFLNLLFASSSDKVEIFRNLFKTEIYDRINKVLGDKSRKLGQSISEIRHRIDETMAGIHVLDSELLQEEIRSEHPNYERIFELLQDEIRSIDQKIVETGKKLELTDQIYQQKSLELNKGTEHNKNVACLEEKKLELIELEKRREKIQGIEGELQRAKTAQTVEVQETLYQEAKKRSNSLIKVIEEEKIRQEVLHQNCKKSEEEMKKLPNLEEQQMQWLKEKQQLEAFLPILEQLMSAQNKEADGKQRVAKAKQQYELVEKNLEAQKQQYENKKKELKNYEQLETLIGENKVKIQEVQRMYDDIRQALQLIRDQQIAKKELECLQEEYQMNETAMKLAKQSYEEKELRYKQAAVGLVARFLVENEPCPVCGSLEHPKPATISHDVPEEEELERDKKKLEEITQRYNESYKKAANQNGLVTSKQEEINRFVANLGLSVGNELNQAFETKKAEGKHLIEQKKKLEEQQKLKEDCQKIVSLSEEAIQRDEEKKEQLREKLIELQQEYERIKERVIALTENIPEEYRDRFKVEEKIRVTTKAIEDSKLFILSIQQRKEEVTKAYSNSVALLESYEKDNKECHAREQETRVLYEEKLRTVGFVDEESYKQAKRTAEVMEQMISKIQSYQDTVKQLEIEIKQLSQVVGDKPKVDLLMIEQEIKEQRVCKQQIQEAREGYITASTVNRKAYDSMKEKYRKYKELSEEFGYIKDLENTAKGANSERLVFEQYVLAAYFEDILNASNIRLSIMTNSRYELMKVDKVSDQRTKDSLDLEVFDHYTGKRRSVKTLRSGCGHLHRTGGRRCPYDRLPGKPRYFCGRRRKE